MGFALTIVQQAYEALSHQDIPAVLDLVADEVDSDFIGSASTQAGGKAEKSWQSRKELADFFAAVGRAEDIHALGSRNLSRDAAAEETTCMKLDMMR